MNKLIEKLEGFIENNYTSYFDNNPYNEFKKFLKLEEFLLPKTKTILLCLFDLIEDRFWSKGKVKDIFGHKLHYRNPLPGVSILVDIPNEFKDYILDYDNKEVELKTKKRFYYLTFLLTIIISSQYSQIEIRNIEDYKKLITYFETDDNSKTNFYFRGQSNSKWNLMPSCLRNINQKETYVFDYERLINTYKIKGVYDEYVGKMNPDHRPYDLLAFMQHTNNKSPLIDFTENFVIGSYFALNNYSDKDFNNKHSAVFVLMEDEEASVQKLTDDDLLNLKIGVYKKDNRSYEDYKHMFNKMKRLYGNDASTKISLNKPNDRMRYQRGLFLFFNDYIISDSLKNVIYSKEDNYHIIKIEISKEIKSDLLKLLRKDFPYFDIEYLMNPFKRFEEDH